MDRSPRSADQTRQILSDSANQPLLEHEVVRQMSASWTKRQAANLKKRDVQISDVKETGPLGLGIGFPPSEL